MAGRRAKWTDIWETWVQVPVTHIWGTLDLIVFKVILGLFGALVWKWSVTRKRLALGQNWVKFGSGVGVECVCVWGGGGVIVTYVYGVPITF